MSATSGSGEPVERTAHQSAERRLVPRRSALPEQRSGRSKRREQRRLRRAPTASATDARAPAGATGRDVRRARAASETAPGRESSRQQPSPSPPHHDHDRCERSRTTTPAPTSDGVPLRVAGLQARVRTSAAWSAADRAACGCDRAPLDDAVDAAPVDELVAPRESRAVGPTTIAPVTDASQPACRAHSRATACRATPRAPRPPAAPSRADQPPADDGRERDHRRRRRSDRPVDAFGRLAEQTRESGTGEAEDRARRPGEHDERHRHDEPRTLVRVARHRASVPKNASRVVARDVERGEHGSR